MIKQKDGAELSWGYSDGRALDGMSGMVCLPNTRQNN